MPTSTAGTAPEPRAVCQRPSEHPGKRADPWRAQAIARWYEVYGYDDAMVQEAAVQAGAKRDLWYWNSILKTWNAKGLRTVHDVRSPVAIAGASRNLRVDREAPSGNDFLKNAARRRPLKKKPE